MISDPSDALADVKVGDVLMSRSRGWSQVEHLHTVTRRTAHFVWTGEMKWSARNGVESPRHEGVGVPARVRVVTRAEADRWRERERRERLIDRLERAVRYEVISLVPTDVLEAAAALLAPSTTSPSTTNPSSPQKD